MCGAGGGVRALSGWEATVMSGSVVLLLAVLGVLEDAG